MTKEEFKQRASIAAMQGMLSALVGNAFMMENWAKSAARDNKTVGQLICEYSVNYAEMLVDELNKRDGDNKSDILIADLGFSTKVVNGLESADIRTLEDLLRVSKTSLMKVRNFGKKSILEIEYFYSDHNYQWGLESLECDYNSGYRRWYLPKKR